MTPVGFFNIARSTPTPFLKAATRKSQHNQGIQSLHGHGGESRFVGRFQFQVSGNAADTAESIGSVTRKFFRWDLGLARRTDSHSNHLSTTVNVGADGFADVGADAGKALGKFRRGDAINGESIVIDPLNLLNLTGFESLGTTINSFDMRSLPKATKLILNENQSDCRLAIKFNK